MSNGVGNAFPRASFFQMQKVEFVFAQEAWNCLRASLLGARNSIGYSPFDKSNSASGMGTVAMTVVPP
jgi:hypothetical protein